MEFINRVQGWNTDEFEQFLRELESVLLGLPVRGSTEPTPTAGSGTLTSATATVRFTRMLDRCLYEVRVGVTTNGTGATYVAVPMPFMAAQTIASNGANAGSGAALSGLIVGSELRIFKHDGTYPAADGSVLLMSGNYRISR